MTSKEQIIAEYAASKGYDPQVCIAAAAKFIRPDMTVEDTYSAIKAAEWAGWKAANATP